MGALSPKGERRRAANGKGAICKQEASCEQDNFALKEGPGYWLGSEPKSSLPSTWGRADGLALTCLFPHLFAA